MTVETTVDFAGQSVVGTNVAVPWLPGTWEITQGWGATDYGGEPEGHGYPHWHAGVDVGVDCGTTLTLPSNLTGTARALDNPGGYGTALVVSIDGGPDILFGHLRQRLVQDGAQVRGGDALAITNNTGNSTGCHLHFEVRPQGGRYGTDVNPSAWLLDPAGAGTVPGATDVQTLGFNPLDPLAGAEQGIKHVGDSIIAGGQVILGTTMLLGGLLVVSYGVRGRSGAQLQQDAARTIAARRRPVRPRVRREDATGAARTRLRPNLQRRAPRPAAPAPAAPGRP